MKITFLSPLYITILIISGLISFLMYKCLKTKDEKKIKIVLLILSLFNIFLFFVKGLDKTSSWVYLTINNICAFSTFILPFSFIIKNKFIKDCIYSLSLVGGGLAIIVPTGYFTSYFLLIRFYLEHIILFIVPLFIYIFKLHKYTFGSFILLPLYFLFVEFIVYLNNILLVKLNLINELDLIFYYNDAFIYGPYITYNKPFKFITILLPDFLKSSTHDCVYLYYFYLIIPTSVYLYPLSFLYSKLMSLVYNKKGYE